MLLEKSLSSYERAEQDAIRAAAGNCAGLAVLNAGSWKDSFVPRVLSAGDLTDLCISKLLLRQQTMQFSDATHAGPHLLPFRSDSFDTAISAQVLPHIADREFRSTYLSEIARVLKPGGRLVVTTMHFNFRFRRNGWPKQGCEEGVYYQRYLPDEFRAELERSFEVQRLHGFWIYLPKTYSLYSSLGRLSVYWERALRNLPLSVTYGKFLLAVCRPKIKERA